MSRPIFSRKNQSFEVDIYHPRTEVGLNINEYVVIGK